MTNVNKFIIIFFAVIFTACSSTKQTETVNKTVADSSFNYNVSTNFIEAKRNLYQGNSKLAAEGFESCIKMNPKHDASYYELARMYETINPEKSIELCKKAISIDNGNIWYYELLLRIYQQQKQFDNALKVNKELISIAPDHKEYYYQWANLCILNKDLKQALIAYNKITEKFGYEDGVYSQIKQIYLKQGNYNKAIETLEEMLVHQPRNKDYYGMIAEIYSNEGRHDKAYEYYQKILQIDPEDGFVHFALADYYRSTNNIDKAIEELSLGMGSPSLDIDSKMKVLLGMLEISKKDSSYKNDFEKLLKIAYSTNPYEPKILALKADYAMQNNDFINAIITYRKVLKLDSSKYVVWSQLLKAEDTIKDYNAMKTESERALHLFPQQPDLYYHNAIALSKEGNWKKAKERISMGGNFVYNMNQKALFLALRAKSEMQLGEKDDAKANYERAISMDPTNYEIKKDYAFALASHNLSFDAALKYSKEALELNAENPEYIYVYAYCLFKNGQVEEALKWLNPAMKKFPENKKLELLNMEINKNE